MRYLVCFQIVKYVTLFKLKAKYLITFEFTLKVK